MSRYSPLAIAVSGGIDSITLATIAHKELPISPLMIHAVSPAVPLAATGRVEEVALKEGWNLRKITAGEFADPDYLRNPYNRCYFCKSNLYSAIRTITDRRVASGANADDLADYRPGLQAAAEQNVVHPYVDAGIDKNTIRQISRDYGLRQFSDLPAQPCLASRVETGIRICRNDLLFIDAFETSLRKILGERTTIRVRIRPTGVHVELGSLPDKLMILELEEKARYRCLNSGYQFGGIAGYRQGSSFVPDKVA